MSIVGIASNIFERRTVVSYPGHLEERFSHVSETQKADREVL